MGPRWREEDFSSWIYLFLGVGCEGDNATCLSLSSLVVEDTSNNASGRQSNHDNDDTITQFLSKRKGRRRYVDRVFDLQFCERNGMPNSHIREIHKGRAGADLRS